MFTFKKQSYDPIFYIDNSPVYTTFTKVENDRIPPYRNTGKWLDSDEFRERYNLTKRESVELKRSIQSDTVPESKLKAKFYTIRRDLNTRLYTEIDLRGTTHNITWKYPKDVHAWPETAILIGSSNTGKTFYVTAQIIEALKRPKKRHFIYVSPELTHDTTLKKLLNNSRWTNYFQGVDVSDEAIAESEKSVDAYWVENVEPILLNAKEGTRIILDDSQDSKLHKHLQRFLIRYLRTGRHKKVGVTSITHSIKGGKFTSQSFSSCKWVTLFVRGAGRGKIVEWLYDSLGIGRKRAHQLVELFSEFGRTLSIHQWAPGILFGPKYAVWI
jgi:hypothetical protein